MSRWAPCLALLVLGLVPAGAQEDFPAGSLKVLRSEKHLSAPVRDPFLDGLCAARAAELAAAGVLAHEDTSGRGPGLQAVAAGGPPGEYGEVLGAGALPGAVWRAWLASGPHREVLQTPGWTKWGAASALRGGTTVWVVRFWRP